MTITHLHAADTVGKSPPIAVAADVAADIDRHSHATTNAAHGHAAPARMIALRPSLLESSLAARLTLSVAAAAILWVGVALALG